MLAGISRIHEVAAQDRVPGASCLHAVEVLVGVPIEDLEAKLPRQGPRGLDVPAGALQDPGIAVCGADLGALQGQGYRGEAGARAQLEDALAGPRQGLAPPAHVVGQHDGRLPEDAAGAHALLLAPLVLPDHNVPTRRQPHSARREEHRQMLDEGVGEQGDLSLPVVQCRPRLLAIRAEHASLPCTARVLPAQRAPFHLHRFAND
mmetsp:Transcript_103474/g.333690  ORF Transcript_103474/g.333690 Transcript_103474/m.333690 type:complete len:205 (+) Transcript_103474:327-941(+)